MKLIHKVRNWRRMKDVREWVAKKEEDDVDVIYSPIRAETDADAVAGSGRSTFDVLIDGRETRVADGECHECGGYDCRHVDAIVGSIGGWGFCKCGALAVKDRLEGGVHHYDCADCGRERSHHYPPWIHG